MDPNLIAMTYDKTAGQTPSSEEAEKKRNKSSGKETTSDTSNTSQPQESTITTNYALISNGQCLSCLDNKAEDRALPCWECDRLFHAVCFKDDGTEKEGKDIICPSSFFNTFIKASNKDGVFAKRHGNFTFVCDVCKVNKGKKKAADKSDKFTLLDHKIDEVNNSLLLELKELKSMISQNNSSATHQTPSISESNTEYNPWNDKQRTENLKKVVSVQKDSKGKLISSRTLEKICVENGLSVSKTFHMQKSDTTGMILNSQHDVDVLTKQLKNEQHSVVKVSTRVPTVHIVGLSQEYDAEELKSMLQKQNPGISKLFESSSTSIDDKLIEILAVKPLKNNNDIYKAIVKVSNVIRSIIAQQGDKVFMGYQSMCKVYDSVFVLRCFKCQKYGHHSRDCEHDQVCGFCSGDHATKSCVNKTNELNFKCCNCVKAGSSNTNHHTGDPRCSVFVDHQNKIKRTIPFYQSK